MTLLITYLEKKFMDLNVAVHHFLLVVAISTSVAGRCVEVGFSPRCSLSTSSSGEWFSDLEDVIKSLHIDLTFDSKYKIDISIIPNNTFPKLRNLDMTVDVREPSFPWNGICLDCLTNENIVQCMNAIISRFPKMQYLRLISASSHSLRYSLPKETTLNGLEQLHIARFLVSFENPLKSFTTTLRYLTFEETGTSRFNEHFFNGCCDKMINLIFRNNEIETVSVEGPLEGFSKIKYLQLPFNKLTTIQNENVFKYMKTVERIHLNDNEIHSIEENAFDGMTNLSYLTFRQNKLSTVPNFSSASGSPFSITELILANNAIDKYEYGSLQQLTQLRTLNLQNNLISRFQLSHPKSLRELHISNNRLISFAYNMTVNNLIKVDISNNRMVNFDEDLIKLIQQSTSDLMKVDFSGNPWRNCDAYIRWSRGDVFKTYSVDRKSLNITWLRDGGNKTLTVLNVNNFTCDHTDSTASNSPTQSSYTYVFVCILCMRVVIHIL